MIAAISPRASRGRACPRGLLLLLIPPDCWRGAVRSAATVAGVLGIALAALAVLVATEPLGAWLLSVASGGHP